MSVTLEELIKATNSLKVSNELLINSQQKEPLNAELHKALRDACIQRFEFCIELAWKTSVRLLGLQSRAPNPAVRDMAQNQLIDDPQIWFDFLAARNKTSHTYDEDIAIEVFREIGRIIPELDKLISRLEKLK